MSLCLRCGLLIGDGQWALPILAPGRQAVPAHAFCPRREVERVLFRTRTSEAVVEAGRREEGMVRR